MSDAGSVAQASGVVDHRDGCPEHVGRIVIDRVELDGSVVDDLVAPLPQLLDEVGLELEAGVVGADVHAHGAHSSRPRR